MTSVRSGVGDVIVGHAGSPPACASTCRRPSSSTPCCARSNDAIRVPNRATRSVVAHGPVQPASAAPPPAPPPADPFPPPAPPPALPPADAVPPPVPATPPATGEEHAPPRPSGNARHVSGALHPTQSAPRLPHAAVVVPLRHTSVESQQPDAHERSSHFFADPHDTIASPSVTRRARGALRTTTPLLRAREPVQTRPTQKSHWRDEADWAFSQVVVDSSRLRAPRR